MWLGTCKYCHDLVIAHHYELIKRLDVFCYLFTHIISVVVISGGGSLIRGPNSRGLSGKGIPVVVVAAVVVEVLLIKKSYLKSFSIFGDYFLMELIEEKVADRTHKSALLLHLLMGSYEQLQMTFEWECTSWEMGIQHISWGVTSKENQHRVRDGFTLCRIAWLIPYFLSYRPVDSKAIKLSAIFRTS